MLPISQHFWERLDIWIYLSIPLRIQMAVNKHNLHKSCLFLFITTWHVVIVLNICKTAIMFHLSLLLLIFLLANVTLLQIANNHLNANIRSREAEVSIILNRDAEKNNGIKGIMLTHFYSLHDLRKTGWKVTSPICFFSIMDEWFSASSMCSTSPQFVLVIFILELKSLININDNYVVRLLYLKILCCYCCWPCPG